jgi:hypothetical protein
MAGHAHRQAEFTHCELTKHMKGKQSLAFVAEQRAYMERTRARTQQTYLSRPALAAACDRVACD